MISGLFRFAQQYKVGRNNLVVGHIAKSHISRGDINCLNGTATKLLPRPTTIATKRTFISWWMGSKHSTTTQKTSNDSANISSTSSMAAPSETVTKSEAEWKQILSKDEYHVIREKGTERAFTGEYDKFYPTEGHFVCRACQTPLYSAAAKFDSGCGWPAFDKCYAGAVKIEVDTSYGMRRVEIMCAACGGHLGHVFEGERKTPTNERHCVNSVSVKYVPGKAPESLAEKKVL